VPRRSRRHRAARRGAVRVNPSAPVRCLAER
jgi:hypothetical protein